MKKKFQPGCNRLYAGHAYLDKSPLRQAGALTPITQIAPALKYFLGALLFKERGADVALRRIRKNYNHRLSAEVVFVRQPERGCHSRTR